METLPVFAQNPKTPKPQNPMVFGYKEVKLLNYNEIDQSSSSQIGDSFLTPP